MAGNLAAGMVREACYGSRQDVPLPCLALRSSWTTPGDPAASLASGLAPDKLLGAAEKLAFYTGQYPHVEVAALIKVGRGHCAIKSGHGGNL